MKKVMVFGMVLSFALFTLASAVATAEDAASCKRRCNTSSVTEDELAVCLAKCGATSEPVVHNTGGKKVIKTAPVTPTEPEICLFTGVAKGLCPDGCPTGQILASDGKSCAPKCDTDVCASDVMAQIQGLKDAVARLEAKPAPAGVDLTWVYVFLGVIFMMIVIGLATRPKKDELTKKCAKCGKEFPASAKFCDNCGIELPAPEPPKPAEPK